MDSQSQFTDIVELIYTAGLCADEWPNALTRIADATGGRMVALRSYDPVTRASLGFFPRNDPEYIASYHAYWAERNSNFQRLAQEPVGAIWHGLQYMTRAEFMRTDYFNEWCGPQELDQTIGSNLARYGATTAFANISRPYRLGPFEPEGVALFTACIPHLRRAMQMNVKLGALAQGERALQRSFDRIGHAVLIVDRDASIVFANRAAETLLAAPGGLSAGKAGLAATRAADTSRLRKAIAASASGASPAGESLTLSRAGGKRALHVIVAPYRSEPAWGALGCERAILVVTDPERSIRARAEQLRQLFDLTAAEAAVAMQLTEGDGLAAVASRLGVSSSTVRTHLTRIFDKTSTHRQAELVRLLLQST